MRLRSRTTVAVTALAGGALALGAIAPAVAAPGATTTWKTKTIAKDLASPKGITLDGKGNVVVGQNAFGDPKLTAGKILRIDTAGKNKGDIKSFGKKRSLAAIAYSPDGAYWTLGANGTLYRQKAINAKPKKVRDLHAWAKKHPDPRNQEDGPATESNPFGLAVTADGDALVTDAAANSLLRVGPKGKVTLVARFAPQPVKTDHLPADQQPPGGLPPTILAESVPTGVAVSASGNVFVGELKGFPFRPGSSHVYKVSADAKNAVCSANKDIKAKKCSVARKNLTSIASLAVNPAGGLVVVEYAKGGVGVFEAGCFSPAGCPDAVVLKIQGKKRTELAKGKFSAPGTIVAAGKNTFYISDHMFDPSGRVTKLVKK